MASSDADVDESGVDAVALGSPRAFAVLYACIGSDTMLAAARPIDPAVWNDAESTAETGSCRFVSMLIRFARNGDSVDGLVTAALIRAAAATLDSRISVLSVLYIQAAGCSGSTMQPMSRGRFLWNDCTAAATPDSVFIFAARASAAVFVRGSRHCRMARASFSVVNEAKGMGEGPASAVATMCPQNG